MNIPVQLLLVQLANMYIEPGHHYINMTDTRNGTFGINVIQITKDQLVDIKRIQDIETENHILSTQLNVTEALLHKSEQENQILRHEQLRHKVKKAQLRNVAAEYVKTKKELDRKISHLAQVETTLSIYEKELGQIKQDSESWRRKCEQYENKFLQAIEGELGKKVMRLEMSKETTDENCIEKNCKKQDKQKKCMEDKNWCCWLELVIGNTTDKIEMAIKEKDDKKCTELSLVEASKVGNVAIISTLLGEDTSVETSFTKTPLHWATENGHYEACSLLLNKSADINAQDSTHFNTTPVHVAAELGQIPILELFLQQKETEIDAKDTDGWTPLHWAVTFEKEAAVKLLLNYSADESAADNDGESPLHLAALSGNPKIVELLLTNNTVNAKDNEGRTPLHLATLSSYNISDNASHPCKKLHRYNATQTHGIQGPHPPCLGMHECKEVSRILLFSGANPYAKDKKGLAPLNGTAPECAPILESWIKQNPIQKYLQRNHRATSIYN